MATRSVTLFYRSVVGRKALSIITRHPPLVSQVRSVVYTETGGVLEKPPQVRFGLIKVMAVSVPFIYIGGTLSMMGAAFLEENDIFVPQEDDD